MSENTAKKPDIEAIMARIREKVANDLGDKPYVSGRMGVSTSSSMVNSPIFHSEELNYLNAHWNGWPIIDQPVSHRPFFGKIVVGFKRFILDTVWRYLFKDYHERERTYNHNLVRFLNQAVHHIDGRDRELFWQLVEKIDEDIAGVNERIDVLFEQGMTKTLAVEQELRRLKES